MTDTERLYIFLAFAIYMAIWLSIVAFLKATQSEQEKQDETYCAIHGVPYMSNTEFWTGLSIFWPILLLLILFFLLYKAIYNLTKKIKKTMRDYVFTEILPYRICGSMGSVIEIHKGETVTLIAGEEDYVYFKNYDEFHIKTEDVKKYFCKVFSSEERKYYKELRDKAAVAAMQGILSNAPYIAAIDDNNEDTIKAIANDALVHANTLVNKIQEMDE